MKEKKEKKTDSRQNQPVHFHFPGLLALVGACTQVGVGWMSSVRTNHRLITVQLFQRQQEKQKRS